MEYKPKARIGRFPPPFGYYVHPLDPGILIPDPKKLEALEYAYKMRTKYKTPYRDCCMWLHMATGQKFSHHGFMNAYKKWLKRLRKANQKEIHAKRQAKLISQQRFVDKNMKHFTVTLDDSDAVTTVAINAAKQTWEKKEQKSR